MFWVGIKNVAVSKSNKHNQVHLDKHNQVHQDNHNQGYQDKHNQVHQDKHNQGHQDKHNQVHRDSNHCWMQTGFNKRARAQLTLLFFSQGVSRRFGASIDFNRD